MCANREMRKKIEENFKVVGEEKNKKVPDGEKAHNNEKKQETPKGTARKARRARELSKKA